MLPPFNQLVIFTNHKANIQNMNYKLTCLSNLEYAKAEKKSRRVFRDNKKAIRTTRWNFKLEFDCAVLPVLFQFPFSKFTYKDSFQSSVYSNITVAPGAIQ